MNARFVLIGPEPRPGDIKLKLPCIVGRSKQAGLTIIHSSISRQHCELTEYEGQLVANDLGSLNGTFINDVRISEPTILPPAGILRLGSVILEARYGEDADLAPPSANRSARTAEGTAEADPELEMLEFEADDASPADEQELALNFEDEDTASMSLDMPASPAPAQPKPAAKAKPNPAAPPLPKPVGPPKPPAVPAAADAQTVSFVPSQSTPPAEEVDPDLADFFKTLQ